MAKFRPLLALATALLVAACSSSPSKPNPAYYLGETYLRRGQIDMSIDAYKVFISDPGHNPDLYLPRAYYMLAFAYYRQGKFEEAMSTLDELERRYPESDSVQVWTLRGDTSRDLGNRIQALQEYDEAWRFAGPMDRIRLETRVQSTLKEMSADELAQAERLVSDPVLHQLTTTQLVASGGSVIEAEDEAALQDNAAALADADAAPVPIKRSHERHADQPLSRAEEQELAREQAKGYGILEESPPLAIEPEPVAEPAPTGPGKVVCLAPLSGPDASVGQKVCDSVTAAFAGHSDRVMIQDAGETSNAARAAWMTAVEDPNVVGGVAWLPADSMQALAPLVESSGAPMIAVSGAAGSEGRYLRGWTLGRSQEVDALARYMIDTVRISRFGVLYPETPAGNDYLDRFSAGVRSSGGTVVGQQFYRPGGNTAALLSTVEKWRRRDLNVDAVFIPDRLGDVQELVTEINSRYPDLIVLGLSSWNGTVAPIRAFVASGADNAAYDAASAFYGAVVGAGANTRSSVQERLRNVESSASASNVQPMILRIEGGSSAAAGG